MRAAGNTGSLSGARVIIGDMLNRLKFFVIDAALWFFWFPFRKAVQWMPLRIAYLFATLSAWGFYIFAGRIRRETHDELRRCLSSRYPEKSFWRMTLQSFEIYMKRNFENLFMGKLTADVTGEIIHIEGIEHLDSALKRGKGVILLLSHFGSFLLILPALGFRGYRINQIGGPPQLKHHRPIHQRIFEMMEQEYNSLPVTFFRSDKSMYSVIRALKNNELVAVAFDGREGNKWVPVKFFGQTAFFAPGPVRLSRTTGATILPTFIIRQRDNTHKLVIERPFELKDDGATNEGFLSANIQRLAEVFEGYITRYPCHFGVIFQRTRERAEKGSVSMPFFQMESAAPDSRPTSSHQEGGKQ